MIDETTEPSDGALLEFAFRNRGQQRAMLGADFGGRSLPEIRTTIIREAHLAERWTAWADRKRREPVALIEAPPRPERIPDEPLPEPARIVLTPSVPERFKFTTLDGFRVDFSGPEYQQQLTDARAAVAAWIQLAIARKPACLALVGSAGCGKSHLLWSAVDRLSKAGVCCYARSWYRLADELRYGGTTPWLTAKQQQRDAHELRQLLLDAPAVAIDEVCATAGTVFDESELGKIVKNAWDNRQALIITTNVHPLSNLMGDAAADRFTTVQLTAPSGRNR